MADMIGWENAMGASDPNHRLAIAEAGLRLLAERPWKSLDAFTLAEAAGLPIEALTGFALPDLADLAEAAFDRAVGKGMAAIDHAALVRDRLFDLAMRRFEAIEPHRAAVLALEQAEGRDPAALAVQHARAVRSARWILALAGLDAVGGVALAARAQGLAVILTQARAAWRQDGAGDFAKTMKALDGALRQAEQTFGKWAGFEGKSEPQPNKPAPDAPAGDSPPPLAG